MATVVLIHKHLVGVVGNDDVAVAVTDEFGQAELSSEELAGFRRGVVSMSAAAAAAVVEAEAGSIVRARNKRVVDEHRLF